MDVNNEGFFEPVEQEPVAMKFKIYKPTVPDPMRQDINDALLPWVYDQSRGSGFVASMWVTPVSTLPPQRKEPEQEPVAWRFQSAVGGWAYGKEPPIGSKYAVEPLYTTPPQRTWVGLTNDEINNLAAGCHLGNSVQDAIYKAVAKLKDKNT